MSVVGLLAFSFAVLIWALWLRWEPGRTFQSDPLPLSVEPQVPVWETILSEREILLSRFEMPLGRKLRKQTCPDCRTLMEVIWVDSPDRPGARMAYCQKCGHPRYDMLPDGQVLTL